MMSKRFPRFRELCNLGAIVGALLASVTWTLLSVRAPVEGVFEEGASPLGYTRSLALFLIPIAVLAWWFLRHPEYTFQKRAFWRTIGLLTPLGFCLDLVFANTFFVFPNHDATLGRCASPTGTPLPWSEASLLCIPARGGVVPVEEFVFYLSGFLVVLLTYIWADEYWLAAYNIQDYKAAAADAGRLLRFHPAALYLGIGLIVLVLLCRWLLAEEGLGGWPGYAVFLILFAIVPTVGLFRVARDFINWRAFAFTFFLILLVSLIWEVTLALPFGWWGYNESYMIGLFVKAWFELPIEAVFVWLAVTCTTVVVFEAMKVWQSSGETARRAFLGVSSEPPTEQAES